MRDSLLSLQGRTAWMSRPSVIPRVHSCPRLQRGVASSQKMNKKQHASKLHPRDRLGLLSLSLVKMRPTAGRQPGGKGSLVGPPAQPRMGSLAGRSNGADCLYCCPHVEKMECVVGQAFKAFPQIKSHLVHSVQAIAEQTNTCKLWTLCIESVAPCPSAALPGSSLARR
jgi:hypothetical protein